MYAACSWLKSNDQVDIAILCIGAAGNGTKHADALQRVLAREASPMLVKVRENLCSSESCDHSLPDPSIVKHRPYVSVQAPVVCDPDTSPLTAVATNSTAKIACG